MNQPVSYKRVIFAHFIIPMVMTIVAIYSASCLLAYLFPAWFSTVNFQMMLPVWCMIYAQAHAKNVAKRALLPDALLHKLQMTGFAVIIIWMYWVLRSLYSPMMSLVLAIAVTGFPLGGGYLGEWLEKQWKRRRSQKGA